MAKTRIFISWSGGASGTVAEGLNKLLVNTFDNCEPFLSTEMPLGTPWFDQLREGLRTSKFAVICVTRDNLKSQWLHFEAGAIGMAVADTGVEAIKRVVPFAVGVAPADLEPPLSLYQGVSATREGTSKLLQDINGLLDEPLESTKVDGRFLGLWPAFDGTLSEAKTIASRQPGPRDPRSTDDKIDEILTLVRATGLGRAAVDDTLEAHTSSTGLERAALRRLLAGTGFDAHQGPLSLAQMESLVGSRYWKRWRLVDTAEGQPVAAYFVGTGQPTDLEVAFVKSVPGIETVAIDDESSSVASQDEASHPGSD